MAKLLYQEEIIMAYGNYNGYGYGYPPYNYQQYQNPIMQQQTNEVPFSEMHFGTMKEAEAHMVTPNKSVLFFNNPMGEIYVKSADSMGNQSFKTYKQVFIENNPTQSISHEFDSKDFVKKDDLKDFITRKDLEEFKESLKQEDKE
jgi:hypothetical protein